MTRNYFEITKNSSERRFPTLSEQGADGNHSAEQHGGSTRTTVVMAVVIIMIIISGGGTRGESGDSGTSSSGGGGSGSGRGRGRRWNRGSGGSGGGRAVTEPRVGDIRGAESGCSRGPHAAGVAQLEAVGLTVTVRVHVAEGDSPGEVSSLEVGTKLVQSATALSGVVPNSVPGGAATHDGCSVGNLGLVGLVPMNAAEGEQSQDDGGYNSTHVVGFPWEKDRTDDAKPEAQRFTATTEHLLYNSVNIILPFLSSTQSALYPPISSAFVIKSVAVSFRQLRGQVLLLRIRSNETGPAAWEPIP